MDTHEIVDITENRRLTYAFLSHVYAREVTQEFLNKLLSVYQKSDGSDETSTLNIVADGLKGSDLAKVEEELAVDYCGLFLMGEKSIPPYESAQLSPDGSLANYVRDEIIAEYRKEGLNKIEGFTEPEDHIAIEFEFMSLLCQKTIDSIKANDMEKAFSYLQKQKSFFDNHLNKWIPDFCSKIENMTETDFYKGMARFTQEYLDVERETLDDLLSFTKTEPKQTRKS